MMTSMATVTASTPPTTQLTVMKCQDCNAPFTKNDEFGNCTGGNENLTQSTNSQNNKDDEKIDYWWWCRDCMATLCRTQLVLMLHFFSDKEKNKSIIDELGECE